MRILDRSWKRKLNPLVWDRGVFLPGICPKRKSSHRFLALPGKFPWRIATKLASVVSEIERPTILLMSTHSTRETDPQACDDCNKWTMWASSAARQA